jgi:hypothetical protein
MAQAYVDYIKKKNEKKLNDMGSQTNKNITEDSVFNLPNKKIIRLYYSNIYKQKVVSFNISTSKSFIMNREIWNHLKENNILYRIDSFLE